MIRPPMRIRRAAPTDHPGDGSARAPDATAGWPV
jgi:hypothetical protein